MLRIIIFIPCAVLGSMLGHWLFFVCNANGCGGANVVKLPFSTVKFLILNNHGHPTEAHYSKTEIKIKLYREVELFKNHTSWDYYKTLYVKLSFIDWLKYRRFYKQYDKEKENRLEYENLQRVRDAIKAEQEKLEQAAERERKKALDILQDMAAAPADIQTICQEFEKAKKFVDNMDKIKYPPLPEEIKRMFGVKRPSGVFGDKIDLQLQHLAHGIENGDITPNEARILLNLEGVNNEIK